MTERPILFSAPMVRALLDGSKTQTRRVVKQLDPAKGACTTQIDGKPLTGCCWSFGGPIIYSPYGQPGDRLWVRESYWGCDLPGYGDQPCVVYDDEWVGKEYRPAVPRPWGRKFGRIPSIHMPRDCSRILLEIVSVRVERLQDISEGDADAEGCERLEAERYDPDWKLCPRCGGTRLHRELGPNGGVIEDVDCVLCDTYAQRYRYLWESINGAGSWDANPWVWVVEFKRVTP